VKHGLVIMLVVVGLAAAAGAQPMRGDAQDPLAGARVFGVKGCARCHAVNGVGGKDGPDLARAARPRSFHDLGAALWNHAPRMADRMRSLGIARPRLDPQEAGDLVAFLFAASYFEPRGSREAGRRVFAEKRCVSCHQVGGVGGVVGPALDRFGGSATPVALAAAMWNHAVPMATTMRAGAFSRPTLTADNLRDVIAYVDGTAPVAGETPLYVLPGNAERGRALFSDKRCAGCHAAAGSGGASAPDLTGRHRGGSALELAAAMWNKAPAMTAAMQRRGMTAPQLEPAEAADIFAYLIAVRYTAAGDPRKGRAVASTKGCLGCHSVRGEGAKGAVDLARTRRAATPAGALAALWNHSFIGAAPGAHDRGVSAAMTGDEMADLVAFLQSVAP
jgi:mono/diheme cytochrome c family protein